LGAMFLSGIAIGAILAFLMSAAFILYNNRINGVVQVSGRGSIRLRRKQEDELKTYLLVKKLKEGKLEAYVTWSNHQTSALVFLVMSVLFVCMAVLTLQQNKTEDDGVSNVFILIGLLGSIYTTCVSFFRRRYQISVLRKLDRFEEYQNELKGKWGNIDDL
jgi:hypothetical protein